MNKWTKYLVPTEEIGYHQKPLDAIFYGTRLAGFLPTENMCAIEHKLYDTLEAFKLLDKDGANWTSVGFQIETQMDLISKGFEVMFAWVEAYSKNEIQDGIPAAAHLIVKIPNIIIKWKHPVTQSYMPYSLGDYYMNVYYAGNGYPSIKFYQKMEWIDGRDYYVLATHPHVNNGKPCWGDMKTNSFDPFKSGNIFASLRATKLFLNTYNKNSPYDPMETWMKDILIFDFHNIRHSFEIGGSSFSPIVVAIPNKHGLITDNEEVQLHHLSTLVDDCQSFLDYGISRAITNPEYSITFPESKLIHGISIWRDIMPLIIRLVLSKRLSWSRAMFIAIKSAYMEWKAIVVNAPKRWPQGVMKKSEYNMLRYWSRDTDSSPYYRLPSYERYRWRSDALQIVPPSNSELKLHDIQTQINTIDSIRGRNCAFALNPNARHGGNLVPALYDRINDPDYIYGFHNFTDDEFAQPIPQTKRLVCKQLRKEINLIDGLYQNAKYLQNKTYLKIIDREKENIKNEANHYRPVATEDKLPFKSL